MRLSYVARTIRLQGGNAIDLDVETTQPPRHVEEDARWRNARKVTRIVGADRREQHDRRAVHVAFENLVPAASTQSFSCSIIRSTSRSIAGSTSGPVSGSNGGKP